MRGKSRVVFDTNVFISAILWKGNCRVCLEKARNGEFLLLTSSSILLELAQKLHDKFSWSDEGIRNVIGGIGEFCTVVSPDEAVSIVEKDPSDNKIFECAVSGNAQYIVSGDKRHVLPIKRFRGIRILSPKEFLELISIKDTAKQ